MTKPVQRPHGPAQEPYLRIGELSARAGVSVATIKYYIREGLLPPPSVKTGRTMGYYDHAYLERLRLIRQLRDDHFLPLRVIKAILLERSGDPLPAGEAAALARVAPSLMRTIAGAGASVSRVEVLAASGLTADELALLEELGLVGEADGRFTDADRDLMVTLREMEAAGLGRERFPLEGLGHYVELLGELARREVRRFIRLGSPGTSHEDLESMALRGLAVSEPMVLLLRRRLIARALREATSR